jgi:hypothetical protein
MDNMSAESALNSLKELSDKRNNLLEELGNSLLVQKIWPEAFANGQRVTLRAVETAHIWQQARTRPFNRRPAITSAYLERTDGVRFTLTSNQFYQLAKEFNS